MIRNLIDWIIIVRRACHEKEDVVEPSIEKEAIKQF